MAWRLIGKYSTLYCHITLMCIKQKDAKYCINFIAMCAHGQHETHAKFCNLHAILQQLITVCVYFIILLHKIWCISIRIYLKYTKNI